MAYILTHNIQVRQVPGELCRFSIVQGEHGMVDDVEDPAHHHGEAEALVD